MIIHHNLARRQRIARSASQLAQPSTGDSAQGKFWAYAQKIINSIQNMSKKLDKEYLNWTKISPEIIFSKTYSVRTYARYTPLPRLAPAGRHWGTYAKWNRLQHADKKCHHTHDRFINWPAWRSGDAELCCRAPGVWCMVQCIINIYMLYRAPPSAQPLTVGIIITQAGVAASTPYTPTLAFYIQ